MTEPVPPTPPGDSPASAKRYRVFLSYSHDDSKWARWLMRRLEGYRVPERFRGRAAPIGEIGARLAPVFRDRDELPTSSDLGETIRTALCESATLVVICSPAAAKSRWVRDEILEFKRLGGSARVFAFIVSGEPKAEGTDDDCFSPALRWAVGPDGKLSTAPAEHVAADARPQGDGKEDAFIRLIAGLLGVGFDDLRQREHARRLRRMMWITAGSAAGMAVTFGLAVLAFYARNDAQRRQENSELVMAQMLESLEARLKKADQLDALDDAGKNVMAYFQSLDPRDLTDKSNTQQAKLLTQIGQMRIAQLHYAEALASFTAALNRTAALVARHPHDGDMLFERAQAEYWIGDVHYKQGEYAHAEEWFLRYRDSAVALAGLDPKNMKWQREAMSGHHNLAARELARGNLAAARRSFLSEREGLEKITMNDPLDAAELESSRATADSFLGTIADRMGDYPEAIARFDLQIARLRTQVKADQRSGRMKQRLATALGLQSETMAIAGQRPAALERRRESVEILDALTAQDPANREWQAAALAARVRLAVILRAQGDLPSASRLVQDARLPLESLAKNAPTSRTVNTALALVWQLETQLHPAANNSNVAAQAVAVGKLLVELDRSDENNLISYANSLLVAGGVAQHTGDLAKARQHWQAALGVVEERARSSSFGRLLDPAARALALLGRSEESHALIARLERIGFQPLEPWP